MCRGFNFGRTLQILIETLSSNKAAASQPHIRVNKPVDDQATHTLRETVDLSQISPNCRTKRINV